MNTEKFDTLVDIITAHYDPKPSFIVQRFKFYNRTRAAGESVATFLAALRKVAEHCEYKDTLKDMLRDLLVCGVNHEGIQRKLLSEKNLTYEKAWEIALTMETAEKGTKDLKTQDATGMQKGILYTPHQKPKQQPASGRNKRQSAVTCYRCLGEHLANACKFRMTECYLCKKVGHIAKACKSKQKNKKNQPLNPKTNHFVEEEVEAFDLTDHSRDSEAIYGMFTIEGTSSNPIVVQVDVNQVPLEMEGDLLTTVLRECLTVLT